MTVSKKELKTIHDHFKSHLKKHPTDENLYAPYSLLGQQPKKSSQKQSDK